MRGYEGRRLSVPHRRALRRKVWAFRPDGYVAGLEERLLLSGLTLSPTTLPDDTLGQPYSATVSASGGSGNYTFDVSNNSLPGGLTLNASSGVISGTPTTTGPASFTIGASDNNDASLTGSQDYTVNINPAITFTTTALPGATSGTAYSQTVSATGGTGSLSYTVTTGSLPTGLTLAPSTGAISGTPTSTGSSSFVVTATDSVGATGTENYSINVNPPITFSTLALPTATLNTAYTQQVSATGGTGTLTYSLASGTLPAGLNLLPSGGITGTPTTAGSSNFTVKAADTAGASATESYTLGVNATAFAISPTSLPNVANGTAYNQQLTTTGGTGTVTFAVTSGSVPPGLTFSNTGSLTGVPTTAGTSNFIVTATDSASHTATQAYAIQVSPTITFGTTSLPPSTIGVAYTQQISATGGTGTLGFMVSSGALPPGLSLSPNGSITGTPTSAGSSTFAVTATDSVGAKASETYTVLINPAITFTTKTLPTATLNQVYGQQLQATGGTGALSYAVTLGSLPAGLTLSSTGALTGTPTSTTSETFTVTATDTVGSSTTQQYTLGVNATSFAISPTSLPNATDQTNYSQQLTTTGGTGAVTFQVTSGAVPAGMTLSSAGLLAGTPNTTGTSAFTITATDANNDTATQAYQIVVNPVITITTTTLPAATANATYNQQLTATGGTGTLTWTLANNTTLPAGLTLGNTGTITGVPTTAGSSTFQISATDTAGAKATQTYNFTVNAASFVFTTTSLPAASVNANYSKQLATTGGTGASTFTVSSGSLPAGLSLSTSGVISGQPTVSGISSFTIKATDTANDTATQAFTFTVNGPIIFTTTSLLPATVGAAYAQQLTTAGVSGTASYAITSGSLPTGLTLSTGGLISGVPTTAGSSTFTVTATDSNSANGSQAFTLNVMSGTATGPAGPTVSSLQRFGFHRQPTSFVLTFDEALNATTAQIVNNYTLVRINRGHAGKPIPLTTVIYNSTNHTVTLTPLRSLSLFATYRLTVNGTSPIGVSDTAGNFLEGQNGKPGTNYVQTFGRSILAGPAPTSTTSHVRKATRR